MPSMNIQELRTRFSEMITSDDLEKAAQFLMDNLKEPPAGVDAGRLIFVRQQAEALAGQLASLNSDVMNDVISFDERTRQRNKIRKSLQKLPEILLNPNHKDPEVEKADLIRTGKKWGIIALRAYLVWTAIVLVLVFFIGKFIFSQFQDHFDPEPELLIVSGCKIEVLGETALYKKPKLKSREIDKIPKGESFVIDKIAQIDELTGFGKITFFGVEYQEKKGWIKLDGLVSANEACSGKDSGQVGSQSTVLEKCQNRQACCLVTGPGTFLHQSPNPASQKLIHLPHGQTLDVISQEDYDHGGLTTYTFYKVSAQGYTGWVMHESCQFVNPACLQ